MFSNILAVNLWMANQILDVKQEAETLLALYDGKLVQVLQVLESQLNTVHGRVQVLLSFCGIIITTTGFSGRLIAGTHLLAQIAIIIGLVLMVVCGAYVFQRIGMLRWVTAEVDRDHPLKTIEKILIRRNEKTTAFKRGGYLLFLGLAFYSFAVAIMLLNPEVLTTPVR